MGKVPVLAAARTVPLAQPWEAEAYSRARLVSDASRELARKKVAPALPAVVLVRLPRICLNRRELPAVAELLAQALALERSVRRQSDCDPEGLLQLPKGPSHRACSAAATIPLLVSRLNRIGVGDPQYG